MPTSDYHSVSDIMGEIQRLSPKSVLDIGVGFGKWGVLCREILDARFGRLKRHSWQAVLIGWEAFTAYSNIVWDMYDHVWDWPFPEGYGGYSYDWSERSFDLVLMIDVLEHFEPERGREILRKLVAQNKHVIVSVPNGVMEQGETFGNPYEAHKWTFNGTEEFAEYKFKLIHQSVCTVVSIEGNG